MKKTLSAFLFLATIATVSNEVKANSLKDHYIDQFEKGHIPAPLSKLYHLRVTCSDAKKPQQGFVGTIVRHGAGVALLQDGGNAARRPQNSRWMEYDLDYATQEPSETARDVLLPLGTALQGSLSYMRESASGELILVGVKSFLGIRLGINPNKVASSKVQVLVCHH